VSIEMRPLVIPGAQPGDLDEIVAHGVSVHLETLCENAIMLIIEDEKQHVHFRISHRGRSRMRVWEYEAFPLPLEAS